MHKQGVAERGEPHFLYIYIFNIQGVWLASLAHSLLVHGFLFVYLLNGKILQCIVHQSHSMNEKIFSLHYVFMCKSLDLLQHCGYHLHVQMHLKEPMNTETEIL